MELAGSSMDGDPKVEQLEATNQQLRDSLKACHELVAEFRSKLAANGNAPLLLNKMGGDNDAARS